MRRERIALTALILVLVLSAAGIYVARQGIANGATRTDYVSFDTSFVLTLSSDVFPLEREANEVVWVSEQGTFFTHGGDKGRGRGYTESDSGIYKYAPGSNPAKVADLPKPLHHIGFAYSPDTGLVYTYAGGTSFKGGGTQIYWFNPADNTTGTCAETYPYNSVTVSAVYSTVQKKTYLFGGFNSSHIYREMWKHDPIAHTVTKIGNVEVGTACIFQVIVYVEPEDAIYLLGGMDVSGKSVTEICRFDCAAEKMTLLDEVCPDNKTKGMGAYYDSDVGVIVLAGGRNGNPWTGYTTRMWVFSPSDCSTRVLSCTLPGFCDDLAGGFDTVTNKGYFMRVTPEGYAGYSKNDPCAYGDNQKYICEVSHRE